MSSTSNNVSNSSLAGKVVLVTGSSRGLGAAIAKRFAAAGATVAVNYANRADAANAVVEEIIKAGGQAHAFQADVSVRSQVLALVDSVVDKWGHLDVLVNNSAISGKAGPIAELTEEEVDQLMATNYKSVIWGIQAASKVLPSGGSIINVSSISSRVCSPNFAAYSSSKAAVNALSNTAARELGPRGIRVNIISPGFIPTDMSAAASPEMRKVIQEQTPLERRFGTPEEVAKVAVFLATSEASWVTGQNIELAGGF